MEFADPALVPLVQQLRRQGAQAVIATDNMDTFDRWTVPSLRLTQYFDGILCSHCLGTLKLDQPSSFLTSYFRRHDIPPAQTILIDDNPKAQLLTDLGLTVITASPSRPLNSILTDIIRSTNR